MALGCSPQDENDATKIYSSAFKNKTRLNEMNKKDIYLRTQLKRPHTHTTPLPHPRLLWRLY